MPTTALSGLTVGVLTLSPEFDSEVTEYTASTTNNTNTVTATAASDDADISILLNGSTTIKNGSAATWDDGENTLTITVTNGTASTVYTVTVTKS